MLGPQHLERTDYLNLTPLAIAALGILILRRPSLIRSWVTTVWFPDNACPMRKESATEANSAFAAAS